MTVKIDGSRSSVSSSTCRGDAHHLEAVAVALPAEAVGVERLVGQRRAHRTSASRWRTAGVEIDRLDRVAGEEVDAVEHLRQPQQVLVVGVVADASPVVDVGHVRRAGDRAERHEVATDLEVVLRIARVERELRRARWRSPRRSSPDRSEPAGSPARTVAPALASNVRDSLVEEVHPDLFEHRHRGVVDRLQLVGGHHVRRSVPQARLSERTLQWQPAALAGRPTASAVAACTGLDVNLGQSALPCSKRVGPILIAKPVRTYREWPLMPALRLGGPVLIWRPSGIVTVNCRSGVIESCQPSSWTAW